MLVPETRKWVHEHETFVFAASFFCFAAVIFCSVIFTAPIVGVSDQGDFSRVFFGIKWPLPNFWNSDHFFKYVTPDYEFTVFPHAKLFLYPPEVSQIYFIYLGRLASRSIGLDHFSQYAYAVSTVVFYILGLTIIYAALLPEKIYWRIILGVCLLIVFMDGRWIQWFNSLYGEPIVMIGMLLTVGLFLWIPKFIDKQQGVPVWLIISLAIAEAIMIGGKLQAIELFAAVLIIGGFLVRTIWKNEKKRILKISLLCTLSIAQILYCYGVYNSVANVTNKDTLYQSVFNGLLLNADNPEEIISEWGLDPAFIDEIGKSAYNPESYYTFGSIRSSAMQEKFYDKVGYNTVLRFYLTHPRDFFRGLQYLGTKSLRVPNHGVHPRGYEVTMEHGRFTLWSDLRGGLFPKNIIFLSAFFVIAVTVSILIYKKNKYHAVILLSLMVSGCGQFIMPYLFNGTVDTAKQLMVFDFIFDILFFACVAYFACRISAFITRKKIQRKNKSH